MEINGIAHIQITAGRYGVARAFYRQLLPLLTPPSDPPKPGSASILAIVESDSSTKWSSRDSLPVG